MKKIIALVLSSLLASVAMAQAPVQMEQPVAPAVKGRVITEPAPSVTAKKQKAGSKKSTTAKKPKKSSGKKVTASSKSHHKTPKAKSSHKLH